VIRTDWSAPYRVNVIFVVTAVLSGLAVAPILVRRKHSVLAEKVFSRLQRRRVDSLDSGIHVSTYITLSALGSHTTGMVKPESYISNDLHAVAHLDRIPDQISAGREVYDSPHDSRSVTCSAALVLLGDGLVDRVGVVLILGVSHRCDIDTPLTT
jgi:hypothetical protein